MHRRKFSLLLTALALPAMAQTTDDNITGAWRLVFTGPVRDRPKMFSEVILNVRLEGAALLGMAHMGAWPGDAPLTDGKIDGDRIAFTAIGGLWSSSGYPRMTFEGSVHDNEMDLALTWGYVGHEKLTGSLPMAGRKLSNSLRTGA